MSRRLRRYLFGGLFLIAPAACRGVLGIEEAFPASIEGDGGIAPDASPGSDAGTCTADLLRDPAHCGRCGHDCGGGACAAGRCRAKEIARSPAKVAAGAGGVAWTIDVSASAADLYTCSGACTKEPRRIRAGLKDAVGLQGVDLVVGAQDVYFLDGDQPDRLFRCSLDSCATPVDLGPVGFPFAVSEPLDTVVYTLAPNGDDCQGLFGRQLASHIVTAQPFSPACAFAIHLTDSSLFYLGWSRTLYRCPRTGCGEGPGSIVAPRTETSAAADDRVYWIDEAAGTLLSCEQGRDCSSGGRQIGSMKVSDVVADSERVYFVDDSRRVRSCLVRDAKCSPDVLFEGKETLGQLTAGPSALYFVSDGVLYQLAKP